MNNRRVRIFFANLDEITQDDQANLYEAIDIVSGGLNEKYGITIKPMVVSDHYIEVLVTIPYSFDGYFDSGRYLRGISVELLRRHNQWYRRKMHQSRLLYFKDIV